MPCWESVRRSQRCLALSPSLRTSLSPSSSWSFPSSPWLASWDTGRFASSPNLSHLKSMNLSMLLIYGELVRSARRNLRKQRGASSDPERRGSASSIRRWVKARPDAGLSRGWSLHGSGTNDCDIHLHQGLLFSRPEEVLLWASFERHWSSGRMHRDLSLTRCCRSPLLGGSGTKPQPS